MAWRQVTQSAWIEHDRVGPRRNLLWSGTGCPMATLKCASSICCTDRKYGRTRDWRRFSVIFRFGLVLGIRETSYVPVGSCARGCDCLPSIHMLLQVSLTWTCMWLSSCQWICGSVATCRSGPWKVPPVLFLFSHPKCGDLKATFFGWQSPWRRATGSLDFVSKKVAFAV